MQLNISDFTTLFNKWMPIISLLNIRKKRIVNDTPYSTYSVSSKEQKKEQITTAKTYYSIIASFICVHKVSASL